MIDSRLSMRSVPPHLRDEVGAAHEYYHMQLEGSMFSPEEAVELGRTLLTSTVADHLFDAGWLMTQAALDTASPERANDHLDLAARAWSASRDYAADAEGMLRSMLAAAYVPTFREHVTLRPINHAALMRRLVGVNTAVVGEHRQGGEVSGIAAEVAVPTLLVRHYPQDVRQRLALPSPSWQDSHDVHNGGAVSRFNFDTSYGAFPLADHPIQVKADPIAAHPSRKHLKKWREQYDDSITVISGGIHLGNSATNPVAVNEMIIKAPCAERDAYLDRMTLNVVHEINLVEARIAARQQD